uniref:Uncharacterized protein n=1 Tax=Steinernema glaseri TaxID=37863 RepID=A0A1I8AAJ8_9BILA
MNSNKIDDWLHLPPHSIQKVSYKIPVQKAHSKKIAARKTVIGTNAASKKRPLRLPYTQSAFTTKKTTKEGERRTAETLLAKGAAARACHSKRRVWSYRAFNQIVPGVAVRSLPRSSL